MSSLAYLGVPENISYLSNLQYKGQADPFSGSTMSVLMLISVLQYQAPYLSPTFSGAAAQAGHAAMIMDGGQAFQDSVQGYINGKASAVGKVAEVQVRNAIHSVGITDAEVGTVLVVAKVVHDQKIDVNGPKIYNRINSHLTLTPASCSIGLNYGW